MAFSYSQASTNRPSSNGYPAGYPLPFPGSFPIVRPPSSHLTSTQLPTPPLGTTQWTPSRPSIQSSHTKALKCLRMERPKHQDFSCTLSPTLATLHLRLIVTVHGDTRELSFLSRVSPLLPLPCCWRWRDFSVPPLPFIFSFHRPNHFAIVVT
jgi:hypothetical protein